MRKFIKDENDPVLQLGLMLHEMVERMVAVEFYAYEIDIMEEQVYRYLNERQSIRSQYPTFMLRAKPKHHFISHYGQAIRSFGPLMSYWTGRFESKHRVAKSIAEATKNVINVSKTITERHQMRIASCYYNGMFNGTEFTLPSSIVKKEDIVDGNIPFMDLLKNFMAGKDVICNEVIFHNQVYKNGDIIVIDIKDSDSMKVGLIQTVILRGSSIYFMTKEYTARRHWLRYFECKSSIVSDISFIKASQLADYKPLIMRGTPERFVFNLHHYVSFVYD